MITAAALAATFNLVCVVTETAGPRPPDIARTTITQKRLTLRLDLSRARWCDYDCTETRPIFDITPTEITLRHTSAPGAPAEVIETVNRESGAYHRIYRDAGWAAVEDGSCEAAPFSGFPEPKF